MFSCLSVLREFRSSGNKELIINMNNLVNEILKEIIENSKEGFRQLLINNVPDSDVLLNKDRMDEREQLA